MGSEIFKCLRNFCLTLGNSETFELFFVNAGQTSFFSQDPRVVAKSRIFEFLHLNLSS